MSVIVGLVCLYLAYLIVVLVTMTPEHYKEYHNFEGNGRGLKRLSTGELKVVKFKTNEDCKRFLHNIPVIDLHR